MDWNQEFKPKRRSQAEHPSLRPASGKSLPRAFSLPWEGGATPRCPSIHPSLLPASGLALGEENLPSCPAPAAEPRGGHVNPAAAFCSGGAARAAGRPAGTQRLAGSGCCRPISSGAFLQHVGTQFSGSFPQTSSGGGRSGWHGPEALGSLRTAQAPRDPWLASGFQLRALFPH